MKRTFPYNEEEVAAEAEAKGITLPHARRLIYQRVMNRKYLEAHREERKQYMKDYKKLIKMRKQLKEERERGLCSQVQSGHAEEL